MMQIIEIAALLNGAHRNQSWHEEIIPEGWALIPESIAIPETFPFVDIKVEDITYYRDVEQMREVVKTRDVPSFDGEGREITITEEYKEQEIVSVKVPYTRTEVVEMTAGVMPEPEPEPEKQPTAQEDIDAMLVDHEYRLTLLELGLFE